MKSWVSMTSTYQVKAGKGSSFPKEIEIYMDCSQIREGTGSGIYSSDLNLRIPNACSAFQLEVPGVFKPAEIMEVGSISSKNIAIYIDSQAGLKALNTKY